MVTFHTSDFSAALVPGPWRHEFIAANGSRFHVAVAGESSRAPLIVLLHTFGQFWWTFRHQIPALVEAGYTVAAMDLRGVAASDKPPSGYDVPTRTRDVAGVIRSLGHSTATIVGHGTGGEVAWAMATFQPAVTTSVASLSFPHPARVHRPLRQSLTRDAARWLAYAQVPSAAEKRLREGTWLRDLMTMGAAMPLDPDVVATYQEVIRVPFAAHTSLEAVRWLVRIAAPRPDGLRYTSGVRRVIRIPALLMAGSEDGIVKCDGIDADAGAFARNLTFTVLDGVGHYLPEEAPEQVTDALVRWMEVTAAPRW